MYETLYAILYTWKFYTLFPLLPRNLINICDPTICATKKRDLLILGPENGDCMWGQGTQTSYNYKHMDRLP